MKIKHLISYNKKILLFATISLITMSTTGCMEKKNFNDYKELDISKISTENTSFKEREEYYSQLDEMIHNLEKDKLNEYYVTINMEFINTEDDNDTILFLRNDDTYKGDITQKNPTTKIMPGIYKLISLNNSDQTFGEIELLNAGEEVTVQVDYQTNTSKILSKTK